MYTIFIRNKQIYTHIVQGDLLLSNYFHFYNENYSNINPKICTNAHKIETGNSNFRNPSIIEWAKQDDDGGKHRRIKSRLYITLNLGPPSLLPHTIDILPPASRRIVRDARFEEEKENNKKGQTLQFHYSQWSNLYNLSISLSRLTAIIAFVTWRRKKTRDYENEKDTHSHLPTCIQAYIHT